MLVQEHLCGRPHHQSRSMRESGLSHTLHPPLLRDIRRDTDEHWQHRVLSCPLTRGDVVCVGSELDRQIAHIHGATIPLQPEAHLLLPHTIFRQRIGPQIVPLLTHPVAAFAHWPRLPPAERLSWFLSCGLCQAWQRSRRFRQCAGYAVSSQASPRCTTVDVSLSAPSSDSAAMLRICIWFAAAIRRNPRSQRCQRFPTSGRNRLKAAQLMQFI